MAKYLTKKRVIAVAVAAMAIGLGTSAFAYFSSTGSGTGTATVGSSTNVTLASPSVGTLYPDGAQVPVDVTITNPGSGSEYVGHVSGSVADNTGCSGTWFQVDGSNATVQTHVRMLDSGTNQDACQGKTLTINWSSN